VKVFINIDLIALNVMLNSYLNSTKTERLFVILV